MIEINGKKLDLDAKAVKSEFYKIEQKMLLNWTFLKERHNLDSGKRIELLMFKKFKRKYQISSEDGEQFTNAESYPSGTEIGLTSMITFKGTPYEVRWFKTKKLTNIEGVYSYEPNSLMIKQDTTYNQDDRELLLYLYMFTTMVKNKPDKLPYTIDANLKAKFYFNDKLVLAQNKNERRNMIAKAIVMLDELDNDRVNIFASINGIDNTVHIDIVRDKIITLIDKKGESMFEQLQDFVVKYDDSFYGIQELVKASFSKKIIKAFYKKVEGEDTIEWYYMKNQNKDILIFTHSGNEKKLPPVIDYMASDTDALNVLRNKYNNISK